MKITKQKCGEIGGTWLKDSMTCKGFKMEEQEIDFGWEETTTEAVDLKHTIAEGVKEQLRRYLDKKVNVIIPEGAYEDDFKTIRESRDKDEIKWARGKKKNIDKTGHYKFKGNFEIFEGLNDIIGYGVILAEGEWEDDTMLLTSGMWSAVDKDKEIPELYFFG